MLFPEKRQLTEERLAANRAAALKLGIAPPPSPQRLLPRRLHDRARWS